MNHWFVSRVVESFEKNKNSEYAIPMKKYMRNQFDFLGIKSPLRQELSRPFLKRSALPAYHDLEIIVKEFWHLSGREYHYFAQELVSRYTKKSGSDLIFLLEFMITNHSWWDTVDFIASNLVGSWLTVYPEERDRIMKRWMAAQNMWLQRAVILFQLKYKDKTDFSFLKRIIMICKQSDEFFIQKAIGWSLREYSKTNPAEVLCFVRKNDLKPLSEREALKWIKKMSV